MDNNTIWLKNGRILNQVDGSVQLIKNLPNKVYTIQKNPISGELYLEEYADSFHFGFKIYGMESPLIEHIMKTFENTTGNLGVLFNGVKGTGKTITSKLIANRMNLPIILVNNAFDNLPDFISKICCNCVLFFDEYEKTFKKDYDDKGILSIMDGVFNSPYRRIFLLTTNNLYVNENLIGRPSRIRYKKTFGNLQPEVVQEYLDDNLKNKKYTQEIIEFIDSLAISTIDILKAIVDELNIHDIPLASFKNFFNVETAKYSWNLKVKTIYDSEDEEDGEYTVEKFKKDLSRIGKKEKNDDDKEYVVREYHIGVNSRKANTSSNITFLRVGDMFGSFGSITKPINEDGILATEDDYGCKYFIKVLNIESKPSLYRGELCF